MKIFYKALQIIFGYDFGYFSYESRKIKYVSKFIFLLRCLLVNYTLMFNVHTSALQAWSWYLYYVAKHLIYASIFIFFRSDSTFFKFDCEMEHIDKAMKCDNAVHSVNKKKIGSLIFFYVLRIPRVLYYCNFSSTCSKDLLATLFFHIICAGCDTLLILMSFIFYSVYYRLIIIKAKLESDADDDLDNLLSVYRLLADVADKFKSAYDLVYLLVILLNVPDVMISIYINLSDFQKNNSNWMADLGLCVLEFIDLSTTLAPALAAGNISVQAENIRILLHDRLLCEENELKIRQLQKLIVYIEARPLKFKVYKVIPLDADLLGMVFNFCVTYLIVIIQLTHLY